MVWRALVCALSISSLDDRAKATHIHKHHTLNDNPFLLKAIRSKASHCLSAARYTQTSAISSTCLCIRANVRHVCTLRCLFLIFLPFCSVIFCVGCVVVVLAFPCFTVTSHQSPHTPSHSILCYYYPMAFVFISHGYFYLRVLLVVALHLLCAHIKCWHGLHVRCVGYIHMKWDVSLLFLLGANRKQHRLDRTVEIQSLAKLMMWTLFCWDRDDAFYTRWHRLNIMIDDFWLNFKSSDFLFVIFNLKWHFQLMLSINSLAGFYLRFHSIQRQNTHERLGINTCNLIDWHADRHGIL